jgi:hypothetical protein
MVDRGEFLLILAAFVAISAMLHRGNLRWNSNTDLSNANLHEENEVRVAKSYFITFYPRVTMAASFQNPNSNLSAFHFHTTFNMPKPLRPNQCS